MMDMAKSPTHSTHRRGFVYTLCIFLLVIVLLEMLAAWAQHSDRRRLDIDSPSDGEILNARLDELSWLSRQSLGVNATLSRNGTQLVFNISDAGFPLTDYGNGGVYITRLKDWLEANWTNRTNSSLSFNVSKPNNTGTIFNLSPANISYLQNNYYTNQNDSANLTLSSDAVPVNVTVDIACSYPANTSTITYTDWSAAGSNMSGTINYLDSFVGTHSHAQAYDRMNANTFSAVYKDSAGVWLQTIHIDWIPNYTLQIWDEANSTYAPAFNPVNITCVWNISLVLNYTNATAETLYVPINTTLTYHNASYNGWLVVGRT